MLDIGIQEILVIMVLALLVFGPDKLPELGRRLGRAMREFRRASDEFRQTVETNLQIHEDLLPPSATADTWTSPAAATDGASAGDAAPSEPATAPSPAAGADADGARTLPAAGPSEPFWTSRTGRLLHRRECAWRSRVPEGDRVPIESAAAGWERGLRPCPACDPREAPSEVPAPS